MVNEEVARYIHTGRTDGGQLSDEVEISSSISIVRNEGKNIKEEEIKTINGCNVTLTQNVNLDNGFLIEQSYSDEVAGAKEAEVICNIQGGLNEICIIIGKSW